MAGRFSKLRDLLMPSEPTATDEQIQGRTEALTNGGTMGFGDELGAAMQGGLAKASGGSFSDTYKQARGENRDILAREHKREPFRAAALEIAGGIPTTALMAGAPLGTAVKDMGFAAKVGATPLRAGLAQAANASIPIGVALGIGKSDADTSTPQGVLDQHGDMIKTALGSAGTAMGLRGLANAATRVPGLRGALAKMHETSMIGRVLGDDMNGGAGKVVKDANGVLSVEGAWPGHELDGAPRDPADPSYFKDLMRIGKTQLEYARAKANPSAASLQKTVAGRLRALLGEADE